MLFVLLSRLHMVVSLYGSVTVPSKPMVIWTCQKPSYVIISLVFREPRSPFATFIITVLKSAQIELH